MDEHLSTHRRHRRRQHAARPDAEHVARDKRESTSAVGVGRNECGRGDTERHGPSSAKIAGQPPADQEPG